MASRPPNCETLRYISAASQNEEYPLSERLAVMINGHIIQIGEPSDVMNHPVDEFVASFVGTETILLGTVEEKQSGSFIASVNGHKIEVAGEATSGETVILCIRPENVTVSKGITSTGTSARNHFKGDINQINPAGFIQRLHIHCGFPLVSYITNRFLEELSLKTGDDVVASFKATAIHAIIKKQ